MTDLDLEIQILRRENQKLKNENNALIKQHTIDLSQIAYYRRQIDFLMDAAREGKNNDE